MAQVTEFQAAIQPGGKAEWTQLEYTVPELVRAGDCVQVDHPCGHRLLAALPSDAEAGTKIYISVPAASSNFPPLVAVKAESIVDNTVGGIKVSSSTALKVVEWREDAEKCAICDATFGALHFRRHHHCRECGASVCSSCSPNRKCVPGYLKDQRVCTNCVKIDVSCEAPATIGVQTPLA